ncbi:hypothetical protein protein, putative [Babesia ovis]|uniref:J domain-containing protein n=1 Tax=Babesia ovis TaxID=5869 RepID=A0A9W5WTS2_BABOV|nr:hypothetical protein protein, putative [Babesia ovis]
MKRGDNSSKPINLGQYRQMRYRKKENLPDVNTQNRLHEYLRELRWGMTSTYDNRRTENQEPSATAETATAHKGGVNVNTGGTKSKDLDDHWKRMMRLHGTVPDSKFAERSATHRKDMGVSKNDYDDYSSLLYESALKEVFRKNDYFPDEEDIPLRTYMRHEAETSTEDESPMILEHEIRFSEPFSTVGTESSFSQEHQSQNAATGDKSYGEAGFRDQSRQSTKIPAKDYDPSPIFDLGFSYEDGYIDESTTKGGTEDEGCHSLAIALRRIADQIDFIPRRRDALHRENEELCKALGDQLNVKHEELIQLHDQLAASDLEKRRLEEKIGILEMELRRVRVARKKDSGNDEDTKGMKEQENGDINEMETLPPVTVEFNDFDAKQRTYIKTLQNNLYLSAQHSAPVTFQAELYRDLRTMSEVVSCRQLVDFIHESIRNDADLLHTRMRHSALKNGLKRIFVEDHLSPFTNRYPYPADFEKTVIEEMENSHPNRRFSMDPSKSNDTQREKMGVLLNRVVLRSIFKYSHIHNLYNYLFTALYCDNFRVVDILKDAIVHRFLDFQMVPEYSKRIRHPIMWGFGDSCNSTQAYRYMKMLDFDFASFPTDPHDGENLWHRIVKGDAVAVAQALKPYTVHTDYVNIPNQRSETPLDISKGRLRRELLSLVVVEIASKGSSRYKDDDFEGALELYSDAIKKQLEVLDNDTSVDTPHRDINLGKLYYNKARSLMHLDRWTETVEACELCMQHIPTYTNAYVTCIQAYEKLLDWNNAVKTCYLMRENCGVVDDEKMAALRSQIGATMFQILGLPSSASPREIKQAFNQLCKQWHPDKIGMETANADIKRRAMNQFNRLYEAREKLLDDGTRMVEQSRAETHYKPPEPIVESSRKCSESGDAASSKIEPLQTHLSKLKSESEKDNVVDERLLQTAVDRLQQQIDEMQYTQT